MWEFIFDVLGSFFVRSAEAALILFGTGALLTHFGLPTLPQTWEMFFALFVIFLAVK